MMKMEKDVFTQHTFDEAANHSAFYNKLNDNSKIEIFWELMQTAYNCHRTNWPKMDKTFFTVRKIENN